VQVATASDELAVQTLTKTDRANSLSEAVRIEYPFTQPLPQWDTMGFSSESFYLERPFTQPLPLPDSDFSSDEVPLERPVRLEQPFTRPHQQTRPQQSHSQIEPLGVASAGICLDEPVSPLVETVDTLGISTAMPSDDIRLERPLTQPIAAITLKALRQQSHSLREFQSCASLPAVLPPVQSPQPSLESGFKEDRLALRERYILDEVLAVGGSSIVYKARVAHGAATNLPSATVAIKTLRPELRANPDAVERLKREFRYTTTLNHPNIVRHFGLEQVSGTWFITMACLEGQSLATLLNDSQSKPLPMTQALNILNACNAALSFAHQRGIAHCDLKPSNVWLTATQEVLVIDFGAAQRCAPSIDKENDNQARDEEHPLPCIATPGYASPQVLAGVKAEQRDDVYSLACVAYELLGGPPPITNSAPLVRPSGMSLRIWEALERGMHWQHAQRTTDVKTLLLDLENPFGQLFTRWRIAVTKAIAQHMVDTREWIACGVSPHRFRTLIATARRQVVRSRALEYRPLPQKHRFDYAIPNFRYSALGIMVLALGSLLLLNGRSESIVTSSKISKKVPLQDARIPDARILAEQVVPSALPALARRSHTSTQSLASNLPWMPFLATSFAWPEHSLYGAFPITLRSNMQALGPNAQQEMGFGSVPPDKLGVASRGMAHAAAKPRISISLEHARVAVSEHAIAAVLLLKRAGPTRDPAIVRWRTIVGSAKPGTDYQDVSSGIARFADNQSVRFLYVPLTLNRNAQGNRSFEVELSRPSAGAALGQIKRAVITIQKHE